MLEALSARIVLRTRCPRLWLSKAATLEAQATANARTGAELFQSQQVGLDCLDRFAGEREALHASLQVAVDDPAAYRAPRRLPRERGPAVLRQDLARVQARSRTISAEWKKDPAKAGIGAIPLRDDVDALRRRHPVILESEVARTLADPGLRAAQALVAAAAAWDRAREAAARLAAAHDETERRLAGRIAREYWATADRLLGW